MGKWHYPKWRRVVMQIVLCLIFGGSIALAQWVVHDRQVNGSTRLDSLVIVGPIGVRPPEGWMVSKTDSPAYLKAQERSGERVLVITSKNVRHGMTAEGYLSYKELELGLPSVPITIGNTKGILVCNEPGNLMLPAAGPTDVDLIAGCVTPDDVAISIVLRCPDELPTDRQADLQLMRDIARRIQVQGDPGRQ